VTRIFQKILASEQGGMSKTEKSKTLTRRQSRALVALLQHPTVRAAAVSCGIGYATINNWLANDAEFAQLLSAAQARVLEQAFGRLALRSEQAVETLERNLSSGVNGVEVRAALGWLGLLVKKSQAAKYDAMEAELERLHALLDAREEGEAH
jgi:hypothetical protein